MSKRHEATPPPAYAPPPTQGGYAGQPPTGPYHAPGMYPLPAAPFYQPPCAPPAYPGMSFHNDPTSCNKFVAVCSSGGSGEYFFIRSELNNMVMDIRAANTAPGSAVIMHPRKQTGMDHQLWYEDVMTTTIRSKLHGMCLETTGGGMLVVRPYEPENPNQKMKFQDGCIHVFGRGGEVLDIRGNSRSSGAEVISYKRHGKANQRWHLDCVDQFGRAVGAPRLFYIRSDLHGKVLDVAGENSRPGAKVVMWPRKAEQSLNQLWYTDDTTGAICSALNNFALDTSAHGELRLQPPSGHNCHQGWRLNGRSIVCPAQPGLCLDIKGDSKSDGATVIAYKEHGRPNQQWFADYV